MRRPDDILHVFERMGHGIVFAFIRREVCAVHSRNLHKGS